MAQRPLSQAQHQRRWLELLLQLDECSLILPIPLVVNFDCCSIPVSLSLPRQGQHTLALCKIILMEVLSYGRSHQERKELLYTYLDLESSGTDGCSESLQGVGWQQGLLLQRVSGSITLVKHVTVNIAGTEISPNLLLCLNYSQAVPPLECKLPKARDLMPVLLTSVILAPRTVLAICRYSSS